MKTTLYQLLEIEPNAKQRDIDSAYAEQTEKFKALREQGNAEASNQLLFLKDAYAILSDPIKRDDYDNKLARAVHEANLQATANVTGNASAHAKNAGAGQSTKINTGITTQEETSTSKGNQEGGVITNVLDIIGDTIHVAHRSKATSAPHHSGQSENPQGHEADDFPSSEIIH